MDSSIEEFENVAIGINRSYSEKRLKASKHLLTSLN